MKWHEPKAEQHFQGNLRHSNPNTPSIIINAAAAASSGSPLQPHRSQSHPNSDIDSVEIVHRKPPRVFPIDEEEEEDDSSYPDDQGDFFVLKRNRKRDRQQLRPNSRQHPRQRNRKKSKPKHRPNYIDDDFEDYLDKRSLTSQQRSLEELKATLAWKEMSFNTRTLISSQIMHMANQMSIRNIETLAGCHRQRSVIRRMECYHDIDASTPSGVVGPGAPRSAQHVAISKCSP